LGSILLNLGITFQDGLGVNLRICHDGFWSENDRKHPTKLFYDAFLLLALFAPYLKKNGNDPDELKRAEDSLKESQHCLKRCALMIANKNR
jgi:hypothetical protein